MKIKRKFWLILLLITFVALAFIAIRYSTQSRELKVMLNASIVTTSLTTGNEVRRSTQDKDTTLGKPLYPEVIIEYKPKDNYSLGDLHNEIVSIFEKENWERQEVQLPSPEYQAILQQNGFFI